MTLRVLADNFLGAGVHADGGTVLAYLPSPAQGVWQLGPVPLRAYALCIIAGIIVAIWWGERRWRDRGGEPGAILDVAMFAVPFGLVGGRLYHVATDWQKYFGADGHPIDALKIYQGGLGIWGAVLLGGIGAWIGCRVYRIPLPALGDALAPPILLAQAIGRLGNYFNQELYGRETDLPWGLEIYRRFDDNGKLDMMNGVSTGQVDKIVHPTFLYELIWNVLIVLLLVWLDRRFRLGHGRLFALYVAGYCFGRFFVELMRDDEATKIAGIRINSFTSAVVFLAALAYVLFATRGRENPADLRSGRTDDDPDGAGDGVELDPDAVDGTARTEEFPALTKPGGAAVGSSADAVGSVGSSADAVNSSADAETTEIDSAAVSDAVAEADAAESDTAAKAAAESDAAATDAAEGAGKDGGAPNGADAPGEAEAAVVGDSETAAAQAKSDPEEPESAKTESAKTDDGAAVRDAPTTDSATAADSAKATDSGKAPAGSSGKAESETRR